MKYVAIRPKPILMFALIIAIAISCGTLHSKPEPNSKPVTIMPLPYIPIQSPAVQTPKQDSLTPKIDKENKQALTVMVQKEKDSPKGNIDSLIALNMAWQRQFLNSAERAGKTAAQRDSLYELIKQVRDTVNSRQTRDAINRQAAQSTSKMFETIITWGLILTMAFQFVNFGLLIYRTKKPKP